MLFPTRYTDLHGTLNTVIRNDGDKMEMTLVGVLFVGHCFDDFQPVEFSGDIPARFTLHPSWQQLCNCEIECDIPVKIIRGNQVETGILTMRLKLGKPDHRNAIDEETVAFRLVSKSLNLQASGPQTGRFEEGLLALQKQFPADTQFKNCFGCAFSDYSVFGNGLFGTMLCFRNQKEAYLKVRDKEDYMKIMGDSCGMVQETYLCDEYEIRPPSTGYRG